MITQGMMGEAVISSQACDARPDRCSVQHRADAIADTALGEDAYGAAGAEAAKCDAHGLAIEVGAVHGKSIDRAQPCAKKGLAE